MSGDRGDRFEVELRDVRRQEASGAAELPGLSQLKARSGSPTAWGRWFGTGRVAVVVAALGLAALALLDSCNASRPTPDVGASPSGAPATSGPTAVPSPSLLAAPSLATSPKTVQFGIPGDVIVARVRGDQLSVVAVHRDMSETSLGTVPSLNAVLGTGRIAHVPYGAFARNGWIAITYEIGDVDTLAFGAVLLDLIRPDQRPIFNDSERYGFLPDGTYVSIGEASEQEVTRWAPPYDRDRPGTMFPYGVFQAVPATDMLSILPDTTGIHLAQPVDGPNGDALP